MKSIKSLLSVAALAISGIAAAASPDAHSVVVRYGDLNLNSQAGVASLHKRIRNAAESVCSELNSRVLGLRDTYDQCVNEAVVEWRRRGRQSESLEFPQEQRKGRGTSRQTECGQWCDMVPISDACIAARAGLIRALARDQLDAAVQAGTDIDRLNRPRHDSTREWDAPVTNTRRYPMTEAEYTLESKLWKAIKDDRTVMLALAGVEEGHSQPMTAQILHDEDERGPIWFFTSKDNDLVKALDALTSRGGAFFVEGSRAVCVAAWRAHARQQPSDHRPALEQFHRCLVRRRQERSRSCSSSGSTRSMRRSG